MDFFALRPRIFLPPFLPTGFLGWQKLAFCMKRTDNLWCFFSNQTIAFGGPTPPPWWGVTKYPPPPE